MPSNNIPEGIMIIPDADDFMMIISQLQEEYDKTHGQTGCDTDEE